MARAAYQNLRGISFNRGKLSKPVKVVERLSLKPPVSAQGTEHVIPVRPKPEGRTILKLRTPLN